MKNIKNITHAVRSLSLGLVTSGYVMASSPIVTCTGFVEVVEGGLSEHNEYKLSGAEISLYRSAGGQRYSAIVKSPEGSQRVFSDLSRRIYKIGGDYGGYEVVGYSGEEQGSFDYYSSTQNLRKTLFEARASENMPERGWDNFVLSCSGDLR